MQPCRQTLDLIFYSPIFQEHKSLVCSFTLRAGGDSFAVSRYLFRLFLHRSLRIGQKNPCYRHFKPESRWCKKRCSVRRIRGQESEALVGCGVMPHKTVQICKFSLHKERTDGQTEIFQAFQ